MSKFYILATGPSINKITGKQWGYLETQHTMGVSWFAKHGSFQPEYHYFHESDQRKVIHIMVENWKHTRFITTRRHKLPTGVINENRVKFITHTPFKAAFNGHPWYNNQPEPPAGFKNVWAKSFDEPLFGFRGSLICAINAATILGAAEIILCGVDLNDEKHFYQDTNESKFYKHLKASGIKLDTHSAAISFDNIRTIVDCIEWLSRHITMYVASKQSLLYKDKILDYRPIT